MITYKKVGRLEDCLMAVTVALVGIKSSLRNGENPDLRRFQEIAITARDELSRILNSINDDSTTD